MSELLIMRHAKSDWSTGLDDFARPLSARGHRNAQRMAEWLEETDRQPDSILTSAADRASTTATYVAEQFVPAPTFTELSDLYLASAATWLEHLRGQSAQRLLICGHNPGLDDLVEYLAGDGVLELFNEDGKLMTTAAIAVFDVEDWTVIAPETTTLVELVRPREFD